VAVAVMYGYRLWMDFHDPVWSGEGIGMSVGDVEIRSVEGVLYIRWNRPDRLNALTPAMLDSAAEAVRGAGEGTRAVVITGTGRAFSSGGDTAGGLNSVTLDAVHRLIRAMVSSKVPVICAVNGLAAGVGVSIAAAGDIVVAVRSSYFLLAFVNLGLMPDGGSIELMAASIGRAKASAMALLGERVPAEEAERIGLIYRVFDDDDFEKGVGEIVAQIAEGPTLALGAAKRTLTAKCIPDVDRALDVERAEQQVLFGTHDGIEGPLARNEKRKPTFIGR
jgi:enoyl-CoA hydratase